MTFSVMNLLINMVHLLAVFFNCRVYLPGSN
jgi:hypothetical protein